MVKYEKLNPDWLSSPATIPFYGEGIVARWGYEALAVEQFVNNRYERLFYDQEKIMSKANFVKQYWKDAVNERLINIENSLTKNNRGGNFSGDLDFLKFEIKKQLADSPNNSYKYADYLTPDLVTQEVIDATKKYVEDTRKDYVGVWNNASMEKEKIVLEQSKDKERYNDLRFKYFNDKLNEFVTNSNEMERSIVYRNRLYQKIDPIYMDPEYKFIKAHFYSPKKMVFGQPVNTLIVNVIVIWTMTLGLYFILYFRLLKKLLDSGEMLAGGKHSD
jgi:hypothetical protein